MSALAWDDRDETPAERRSLLEHFLADAGISRPAWMAEAACRGADQRLFFPSRGRASAAFAAKKICARCPVAGPCLQRALATHDRDSISGGTAEKDRRLLQRALSEPAPCDVDLCALSDVLGIGRVLRVLRTTLHPRKVDEPAYIVEVVGGRLVVLGTAAGMRVPRIFRRTLRLAGRSPLEPVTQATGDRAVQILTTRETR